MSRHDLLPAVLPEAALVYLAGLNLLALALVAHDKRRARRARPRIPERTLLLVALAGGAPGTLLGMLLARHKKRKVAFLARLAAVVLAQAAAVVAWMRWG